jgi:hypothetical protein
MSEADRIAAAARLRRDAEAKEAVAALRQEYRELAPRLRGAVPEALAAWKRRGFEGVVEVRATDTGSVFRRS